MKDDNENTTLAHPPKRVENVEEPIKHIDESIKQSDVMDQLKEATKEVQ